MVSESCTLPSLPAAQKGTRTQAASAREPRRYGCAPVLYSKTSVLLPGAVSTVMRPYPYFSCRDADQAGCGVTHLHGTKHDHGPACKHAGARIRFFDERAGSALHDVDRCGRLRVHLLTRSRCEPNQPAHAPLAPNRRQCGSTKDLAVDGGVRALVAVHVPSDREVNLPAKRTKSATGTATNAQRG